MTTHQMAIDTQTLSCKLLAVTRETKLTLSNALNPVRLSKLALWNVALVQLTVILERVKVYITDTHNIERC